MVFASISFLYFFLPITLAIYYLIPRKFISGKNFVLLISSLFFYFYGEQLLVLIKLLSALTDFICALLIEKFRDEKYKGTKKEALPKILLIVSILTNMGLLMYFKYFNFFVDTFTTMFGLNPVVMQVALPIGISFYTFQTMSYTIDVYKGRVKAQRNLLTYTTFLTMFPQLVAGPIVRYDEVEKELVNRRNTFPEFSNGVRRFVIGLSKKVLIANTIAELAYILSNSSGEQTVLAAWLIQLAFFFQIYFDFSGYTDMAIGLGKMFGFTLPENFDYPYIAKSVSGFWRRWHMTLTRWFKDYIYIPLGGNKGSKFKVIRNILIIWFITGFWHGAAWNFIVWGLYFGIILIIEKFVIGKRIDKIPSILRHIYVLVIVLFGWVIFNADSMGEVISNLSAMFGIGGIAFANTESLYYLRSYAFVFLIAIVGCLPLIKKLCVRLTENKAIGEIGGITKVRTSKKIMTVLEPLVIVVLLVWTTAMLVDGSFNPFIYFRF